MKLSSSCLVIESTRVSICGGGKLSFRQALFRSIKSMDILYFSFDLLMSTTLDSHLR